MAIKLKYIGYYVLLLFCSTIFITCSKPNEPLAVETSTSSQLASDIDYAVLKSDGTVWAWGDNSTGVLGNGTTNSNFLPQKIKDFYRITSITLKEGIALASDKYGNIWFWGNRLIWEEPGELDITITRPYKISYLNDVKKIEILGIYAYLLKNDGSVWRIQMNHNLPTKYLIPEKVVELNNIISISGELALTSEGKLIELPGSEFIGPEWGALNDTMEINNVKKIENESRSYSVILKSDNTVWAWGNNFCANLGNDSLNESLLPIKVGSLNHIIDISIAGGRCLALDEDGAVWFWGLVHYDIEKNIKSFQKAPIKINGLNNIQIIHASAAKNCLFMTKYGTYLALDLQTMTVSNITFN